MPNSGRRELDSISPTHARLSVVLDKLEEMVPPQAMENPMARMFLTILKESKKDLRRLPEEFILALAQPIGQAFTWVANGDPELMTENNLFDVPDELLSDSFDTLEEVYEDEYRSDNSEER